MKKCNKKLHEYDINLKTCPECRRLNKKIYYKKNKNKMNAYQKKYRDRSDNKLKEISRKKHYYIKNKEKKLYQSKVWYEKNKNRKKEKKKIRLSDPEIRGKINEKNKIRKSLDPLYKLKINIRSLISNYIRNKRYKKSLKTSEILGCDYYEIKKHLELTAFKRYGVFDLTEHYHIDHIIPISLARDQEEAIKLNHYSNLQYLTKKDNLEKLDRVFDIYGEEVTNIDKKIEILEVFINKSFK